MYICKNKRSRILLESNESQKRKRRKKGEVYYTYTDGKKVKHIARGKMKIVSKAKLGAIANARKYAHTPEANKKRQKSIKAKGDNKLLGL